MLPRTTIYIGARALDTRLLSPTIQKTRSLLELTFHQSGIEPTISHILRPKNHILVLKRQNQESKLTAQRGTQSQWTLQ